MQFHSKRNPTSCGLEKPENLSISLNRPSSLCQKQNIISDTSVINVFKAKKPDTRQGWSRDDLVTYIRTAPSFLGDGIFSRNRLSVE